MVVPMMISVTSAGITRAPHHSALISQALDAKVLKSLKESLSGFAKKGEVLKVDTKVSFHRVDSPAFCAALSRTNTY